jgi:hypothetical protein
MPTTSPIDGAYYYPEEKTYAARGAAEAGEPAHAAAASALGVRGDFTHTAHLGLSAGVPAPGVGRLALEAGTPTSTPAVTALETVGITGGRVARLGLTVASLLSQTRVPARLGLEVSNSGLLLVPARSALAVRGDVTRPARASVTARRQVSSPARLGLQAQVLIASAARQGVTVGGPLLTVARLGLDVRFGENFLVLADVLQADVAASTSAGPAGYYPPREITCRLLVNGAEVPVKSFQYQEPTGRLGALLNVALAKNDLALVPAGAVIEFDLILRTALGPVTVPVVEAGKLAGRDYRLGWRPGQGGGPDDELSFGALDVMADKFTLAPRRPVVLFNPDRVKYTDVEVNPRDAIVDEAGAPVLPVIEPVSALTMHQVLKRAYTSLGGYAMMTRLPAAQAATLTRVVNFLGSAALDQRGLGFAQVLTNVPDYVVGRADFTVESGWHSGAQPCIGMFNPVYFVVGSTLYVMDVEQPVPAGSSPRVLPLSGILRLSQTAQYHHDSNAVLVTYQVRGREATEEGLAERTRYEETTDKEGGQYGDPGYTEIYTRRKIVEKYETATGNVVSARDEEVVTETRVGDAEGILYLAHRETQNDTYEDDLKTGHRKTVEGLIIVGPDRSAQLRTLIDEKCAIAWADDPVNPGSKVQRLNHTVTEGLVYETSETSTRRNPATGADEEAPRRYPAIVAQASGIIEDDGSLLFTTISTVTETMRHVSGNQYDVSVVAIDHLTGTVKRSTTSPRSGGVSSDPYAVRAKTMLLRDRTSEGLVGPRIPVPVNAGELPRDRAVALGQRALLRLANPLQQVSMDVPGVDFAVRRGSVVVGQTRTGYTARHLVTGFSIVGQNLGRQGHNVKMTVEATELPS